MEDVQATLAEHGIDDAEVQIVNGEQMSIRTPFLERRGRAAQRRSAGSRGAGGITAVQINIEDVGPTWGAETPEGPDRPADRPGAITLYIAIRFELKMAICAIVALIHDVTITVGVYALSGREVTLRP